MFLFFCIRLWFWGPALSPGTGVSPDQSKRKSIPLTDNWFGKWPCDLVLINDMWEFWQEGSGKDPLLLWRHTQGRITTFSGAGHWCVKTQCQNLLAWEELANMSGPEPETWDGLSSETVFRSHPIHHPSSGPISKLLVLGNDQSPPCLSHLYLWSALTGSQKHLNCYNRCTNAFHKMYSSFVQQDAPCVTLQTHFGSASLQWTSSLGIKDSSYM